MGSEMCIRDRVIVLESEVEALAVLSQYGVPVRDADLLRANLFLKRWQNG